MSDLTIQLASGPVTLQRRLGTGASAEVWAVRTPGGSDARQNDSELVLKIARPETARYLASEVERLTLACSPDLPEAVAAGRLGDNVSHREWRDAPYILMTRLPGATLRETLEQTQLDDRLVLALALARDVGRALADLHEAHVAHGDVKPENILTVRRATGDRWRCSLCDLGLSTTGQELLGATPHYLPPEVMNPGLGPSDAVARDLWALGITMLEVLGFGSTPSQGELAGLPEPCSTILLGLLAESAAARPRARWVSQRAGAKSTPEDHRLAVRRKYLAAHRDFLRKVREGAPYELEVAGVARQWLERAVSLLQGAATVERAATSHPVEIVRAEPLSIEQRRHFLVALCGAAAVDFDAASPTEEALLQRLLTAAARRPPEAFTSDLFMDPAPGWVDGETKPAIRTEASVEAPQEDWVSFSLALGAGNPDSETLLRAECMAGTTAPVPFVLAVANVLKRRGELGRARAVLLPREEGIARVALAGVLARSGAVEQALSICRDHIRDTDMTVAAAAAALQARLLLARGELARARACVEDAPTSPSVLEARASVALTEGDVEQARALLLRAQTRYCDAEQRARIHALLAHLEHQLGNYDGALAGYTLAVADASRAGALVEEATYLVGVAATAGHVGKLEEALSAVRRAGLLFEVLGNASAQARAALNRASNLTVVGAFTEGMSAAAEAVSKARHVSDVRCEAFAHLLLVNHGEPPTTEAHLRRAECLLADSNDKDKLRLSACKLGKAELGPEELSHWDEVAAGCDDADVALEWWTARARAFNRQTPFTDVSGSLQTLAALSRLQSTKASVDAIGQAYAAGAELAANRGDGERCLQFLGLARRAHQRIVEGAPSELRLPAKQLPWAAWMSSHSTESPLRAEQIGEVERLVRDLADRSRLRAVLERSLDALVRWTGVERGLLLMNAPGNKLVIRAARNLAREDLTAEHRDLSQSLARKALETGDCVVAVDASGELSSLHRSVHALKLRSVLAVPLSARGDTLGVVYLDDRMKRGAFGPSELSWVRLVSTIAAVAIAEARDRATLRRAARKAARAERQLNDHLAKTRSELVQVKALAGRGQPGRHGLVGASPPMLHLYHLIDRVGVAEIPVLIFGESGTGKELVARALHRASPRAQHPFVTENCSAIPGPLLESILFGHKKGAFTGAVQNHIGLFETADGGTLFLDELGEMSLPMQAKLLRVLETGELRRVGDERVIKVNVRVFGASHRDLERMVADGLFREDLYYRLNVMTVRVPPLRDRASDIPDLVRHFLRHARKGKALPITPEALSALQGYSWPGNVRQLDNELRRASVLADEAIGAEHLSPALFGSTQTGSTVATPGTSLRQQVDALETQLIERALREASGNQSRAAEALGISRFGLQKMVKRLGLSLPK